MQEESNAKWHSTYEHILHLLRVILIRFNAYREA
jgi:hypothetical protein